MAIYNESFIAREKITSVKLNKIIADANNSADNIHAQYQNGRIHNVGKYLGIFGERLSLPDRATYTIKEMVYIAPSGTEKILWKRVYADLSLATNCPEEPGFVGEIVKLGQQTPGVNQTTLNFNCKIGIYNGLNITKANIEVVRLSPGPAYSNLLHTQQVTANGETSINITENISSDPAGTIYIAGVKLFALVASTGDTAINLYNIDFYLS